MTTVQQIARSKMPDPREIGEAIDAAVEMVERLEAAESDALEQARLNGMGSEREAALMAKLEAAEKERDALRVKIEAAEKERDALRAKIEQMEKQEPVSWADAFGEPFRQKSEIDGVASPLYALPGAKGE